MRINTGWERWLHLLILCIGTYLGYNLLLYFFDDWNKLSALSLSCLVTVQVNNVFLKFYADHIPLATIDHSSVMVKDGSHGDGKGLHEITNKKKQKLMGKRH